MPSEPEQPAADRRHFLGGAAGCLTLCGSAPIREEPEEVIPLKSVVATSGQEGLTEFPWDGARKGTDLGHLVDDKRIGPSNLFLVAGKDFDAALGATSGAFLHGASVAQPAVRPGETRAEADRLWAVFYLGAAQSSPCEWAVTRAAVHRSRVRMTVRRPDPSKLWRLFDRRVYMFWVPLGEREPGAFTLEAYDDTNRVLMMTRCVTSDRVEK